jgi:hypothetical protein
VFLLFAPIKVVSVVAACYAALLMLFLPLAGAGLAFTYATVLQGLLMFFCYVGWRKLWSRFPRLNYLLFPDLNGSWVANINWVRGTQSGMVTAIAEIRQDLLKMSIEVEARDSDSSTIAVVVRRDTESGRPLLHYIYEVTDHQVRPNAEHVYRGAASLRVDTLEPRYMRGNYFTARGSQGHFKFERVTASCK